jgi:integrase
MTKKDKRREVAVKRNPGIYRIQIWDEQRAKWQDSKYRAIRRCQIAGVYKKEAAVFDHLETAKLYRSGEVSKNHDRGYHKDAPVVIDNRIRFGQLLENWKAFHFQTIDLATQQTYEKKLRYLDFLSTYPVEEINPSLIDKMVIHWKAFETTNKARHSFGKELDTLKVILNFYRKRHDGRFPISVYREHYLAGEVIRKSKDGIKSLNLEDLRKFLAALKGQMNPRFFPIAFCQFCLSLRIGEACGLQWDDLDFKTGSVRIQRTVVWNYETWEARIKDRPKNGKSRVLVMPDELMRVLQEWKLRSDPNVKLLFHKNGIPMNRQTIAKGYNRAIESCGIQGVSGTHLLRRTSATHANRVTGDFWAVSVNLGHASPEETTRYVSEITEQKTKVANALNGVALEVLKQDAVPQCPTTPVSRKFSLVKSKG